MPPASLFDVALTRVRVEIVVPATPTVQEMLATKGHHNPRVVSSGEENRVRLSKERDDLANGMA